MFNQDIKAMFDYENYCKSYAIFLKTWEYSHQLVVMGPDCRTDPIELNQMKAQIDTSR